MNACTCSIARMVIEIIVVFYIQDYLFYPGSCHWDNCGM